MEKFMETVKNFFSEATINLVLRAAGALVVLLIGFWLIKNVSKLIMRSKLAEKLDKGLLSFLCTFSSVLLKIILLISIVGYLGVPTTSFLTLLGTAGLAIGMSLQGSLSNLAGGILILTSKLFTVGDYIETASSAGTVSDIGLFYTTLVSADNKKLVIPNSALSSSVITNYSAESLRRVDIKVNAGYGSDIDSVNRLLTSLAAAHPLVASDPAPFARMLEMGDSSLVFTLRAWCKNADYWAVYFDLNEQIKKEFDRAHIEIPFPQLDVHSKS